MKPIEQNPRILIITPEITYLPHGMGNMAYQMKAKAGGLADVSASLVNALFDQGADVHVALPDYRRVFNANPNAAPESQIHTIRYKMSEDRIHLAEDRIFFYLNQVYSNYGQENVKIALAFEREVVNNIIPRVRPDLIHCNDWMTGLIPAMARAMNIPCLFTIHNVHTIHTTLAHIEDSGIDAAAFWKYLFFKRQPLNYEETREYNQVDFLSSGVFAAHFVNTVSPTFLNEIVHGKHDFIEWDIRHELTNKWQAECARGILNAPDTSFNPSEDSDLVEKYSAATHVKGKKINKEALQKRLGLMVEPNAPILFWPSRLDPIQKGCQLLADVLYPVISENWERPLQIVFIANGEFQDHFRNIVHHHQFYRRVAVCTFNENLARLAFGGSDFILMPSLFEPCGLPQMIGTIYGALPIVHDTGGLHDTISHLDVKNNAGNGFVFKDYDANGLKWAIDQAIEFFDQPQKVKSRQIKRIMDHGIKTFNHSVTAGQYIELYEKMLARPLIKPF